MAGKLTPEIVMDIAGEIMSEPWLWGKRDCCASACEVFKRLTGINPMDAVEAYSTRSEAYRIIARNGGLMRFAEKLAKASGIHYTEPMTGAISLSHMGDALGPERRALLICIEPGAWIAKSEFGYTILRRAERSWNA